MHEELWDKLLSLDAREVAIRVTGRPQTAGIPWALTMINQNYLIDRDNRRITSLHDSNKSTGFLEQLVILSYLIFTRDIPLRHKWVKPEQLATGEFFFRGPHVLQTDKLEQAFGTSPQGLIEVGSRLGAEVCDFGDASIQVRLLPRVPVSIIVWAGDDEFPARASILVDETAARQLPLDALGVGINLAIKVLTAQVES